MVVVVAFIDMATGVGSQPKAFLKIEAEQGSG
jgi:hypothetical protein